MSAQTIYFKLVEAGMTPESAAGMLGNMQLESGLKANNVQNGYGHTDEGYTAKMDAGQLEFRDGIGYGLCQWTYSSRKLKLLQFARSRGVSIGDEAMQVDFCIHELRTEYSALWTWLCTNKGVGTAADRICKEYERPAVNNLKPRRDAANMFYMQFSGLEVTAPDNAPTGEPEDAIFHTPAVEVFWPPKYLRRGDKGADVSVLQAVLRARGYDIAIDGDFGTKTNNALIAFQAEQFGEGDGIAEEQTWTALLRR